MLSTATLFALVSLLFTSVPALGQKPVASASMEPLPTTVRIDAATRALNQLNRVISVRVENERLDNVLQDIARKADLQLFYGDHAVAGANEVSISLEKTTALAALYEVIRGRPLKLLITPSGHLIVAPDPEAVPPTPAEETAEPSPPAQEGSITGHVRDEDGEPLPGVNVAIVGTTQGAATDADGQYTISGISPGTYSIQASFIGYETQVIEGVEVGEDEVTVLEIQMQPRAMGLDEVVVIGYGTVSARDLTGSVATVDVEDAMQSPSIRIDQLLQGRAPGVHVTSTTGEPGAGTTIRIRGSNSISASNEPLYVIDGVIGAGDLNSINPDDIASIDVLKDATATAIYGARGSNGVVLITTKRGRAGDPLIDVNLQRGWQTLPRKIDMLNATEYAELMNEWELINGREPAFANPAALGQGTDWQDAITRTAPLTDFNLSVRGGAGDLRYFVSGNYFDQRGIIINSGIERYQFRLNLDAELNDRLKIGNTLNVAHVDRRPNSVSLGGTNSSSSALGAPPTMPVYEESGDFASEHPFPEVNGPINNPVAQGLLPIRQVNNTTVLGNLFAQYQLLDGLNFKSSLGVDAEFGKSNSYTPITLPRQAWSGDGGEARVSSGQGATILTENTLNYNKAFGSDHRLNAVAGFTYQTSSSESVVARASGFRTDVTSFNDLASGDPVTRDVDSGYSDWSIISYLGRVNYTLMDRYLFTLVARQDGSSRLGANNKYAFFPAAAFAWRISDEPFLRDLVCFLISSCERATALRGIRPLASTRRCPRLRPRPSFSEVSRRRRTSRTGCRIPISSGKRRGSWTSDSKPASSAAASNWKWTTTTPDGRPLARSGNPDAVGI